MFPVEGDDLREPVWLEIRRVLMASWDPIGVVDEPFAANEYDNYILKIEALLRSGTTVEALMDYLEWVASQRMGFTSQRERARPAAERLLPLRVLLNKQK